MPYRDHRPARRKVQLLPSAAVRVAFVVVAMSITCEWLTPRRHAPPHRSDANAARNIRSVAIQWMALNDSRVPPTVASLIAERELEPGSGVDRWGRPFAIDLRGDDVAVSSAGMDGRFGTDDDVVSGPAP